MQKDIDKSINLKGRRALALDLLVVGGANFLLVVLIRTNVQHTYTVFPRLTRAGGYFLQAYLLVARYSRMRGIMRALPLDQPHEHVRY